MNLLDEIIESAEKATPRPWNIGHVNEFVEGLCDIDSVDGVNIMEDVSDKEAAYIVLAANNADRLAKALKVARDEMKKISDEREYYEAKPHKAPYILDDIENALMQIQKILEGVEGEKGLNNI